MTDPTASLIDRLITPTETGLDLALLVPLLRLLANGPRHAPRLLTVPNSTEETAPLTTEGHTHRGCARSTGTGNRNRSGPEPGAYRYWRIAVEEVPIGMIGYARVSTQEQDPAAQEWELSAAGADRVFVDDGESSRVADCPEWVACKDYLRVGDTLVVRSLDRLAGTTTLAIPDDHRAGGARHQHREPH